MKIGVLIYDCVTQLKGGDNMPELVLLKARIREKKSSYGKLCNALGISYTAFWNKINGRSAFDIVEASKLAAILDISPDEITIFFA